MDKFCSKLGVKSDLEEAERVYQMHAYWKYCEGVLYVFDDSTRMYDEVIFMKIIAKFTAELFVLHYS